MLPGVQSAQQNPPCSRPAMLQCPCMHRAQAKPARQTSEVASDMLAQCMLYEHTHQAKNNAGRPPGREAQMAIPVSMGKCLG